MTPHVNNCWHTLTVSSAPPWDQNQHSQCTSKQREIGVSRLLSEFYLVPWSQQREQGHGKSLFLPHLPLNKAVVCVSRACTRSESTCTAVPTQDFYPYFKHCKSEIQISIFSLSYTLSFRASVTTPSVTWHHLLSCCLRRRLSHIAHILLLRLLSLHLCLCIQILTGLQ